MPTPYEHLTVIDAMPGTEKSTLSTRPPTTPSGSAVTEPTGDAVHCAVAGSTVNSSLTVTVPVPDSVVSSRPSICTADPQVTVSRAM